MNKQVALFLLAASIAVVTLPAQAATGWIDDEVFVPVRAGAGTQFKILHRGLKSGTAVEILEQEQDSDWARIRYNDIEGYIAARYLSRSPTAAIQLQQLQKRHDSLKEELASARSQLKEVSAERDRLASQNAALNSDLGSASERLDHLEEVASDPIRLDQANRELNEQLSTLRTQLDTLQAENAMLNGDNTSRNLTVGAVILLIGLILGLVVKGRSGRGGRGNWVS
ncbi:MAG: TIGR04211 family SH3 domain-containing protein [Alcanivoracaceae bacterium]|jgi:SH3 domain protein|nr:TIGR04211 family SH3 domain-containing protein [Alcanivoracaceae bacterium]